MKKNNKGFTLLETLIVSTFVLSTLIFLYIQFSAIKRSYDSSFKYNTINGLYSARMFADYIKEDGYSDTIAELDSSEFGYVDVTNCIMFNSLCSTIKNSINAEQIIITHNDISVLQNKLSTSKDLDSYFNTTFKKFILTIDSKTTNEKDRLIIRFIDENGNETFADVTIGDEETLACTLTDTDITYSVNIDYGTNGAINSFIKKYIKVIDPNNEGCSTIKSNDNIITISNLRANSRITIDLLNLINPLKDKGYIVGLTQNDNITAPSFIVDKNLNYSVSYNVLNEETSYKIEYVDTNGKELTVSKTYKGNIGDKIIVGYKHIKDYNPNAYNLTKTLTQNDNVFTFIYTKDEEIASSEIIDLDTEV